MRYASSVPANGIGFLPTLCIFLTFLTSDVAILAILTTALWGFLDISLVRIFLRKLLMIWIITSYLSHFIRDSLRFPRPWHLFPSPSGRHPLSRLSFPKSMMEESRYGYPCTRSCSIAVIFAYTFWMYPSHQVSERLCQYPF